MLKSRPLLYSFVLLVFLIPSRARACEAPCNSCTSPPPGTTHIVGISPQVGIAGITYVYVNGYCFGDSQGSGTVTVNGEPMNGIISWSDAEIVFELPFDAQTGDLKVTSTSYGSDDSATESTITTNGNDNINASFTVLAPSNPPFCCANTSPPAPMVDGSPSAPTYVTGTWDYDDGPYDVQTFTLAQQGPQNSDGSWTVTGTDQENPGPCGYGTYDVSGELDKFGDLVLTDQCGGFQQVWRILGSGDVTSQGYGGLGCYSLSPTEYQNFLQLMSTKAEGPLYYCEIPPLFKSQTDLPTLETPTLDGWGKGPVWDNSANATFGVWTRAYPLLFSGGYSFVQFAGRFVYEQTGSGGASDTCYVALSPTPKVTGLSGGGWFVDQGGAWHNDNIGMWSQGVDWYQKNVALPCQFTISQDMYIDGRTQPVQYTTNQLTFKIDANEIYSEVQPAGGSVVQGCEYYSKSKVSNRSCKP